MALSREEVNRKLLHLMALLMPVGIFYLPKVRGVHGAVPSAVLAVLLAASVVTETLRFRLPVVQEIFCKCFGSMLRSEEKGRVTGSTYIIGAALVSSVLFYARPHIAFMSLFAFVLGDGAAALVGLGVGRTRIGSKTLEGSLACLATCLVLFFLVFPRIPLLLDMFGGRMPVVLGLSACVCITVLELVPLKVGKRLLINDNLLVPIVTGLLIAWLAPFL